jgi:hypothetical protein
MTKQKSNKKEKITIDKNFILSSSYERYEYLLDYMAGTQGNYNKPGISDYPFYAYLSTLFNNTLILEIGTFQGGSACMLSHNESNKVISYDVVESLLGEIDRDNIEFKIGNFMDDEIDYDKIDLITIDAAHDGNSEIEMVKYLENNWKGGILFLDDIHNNSGGNMSGFWNSFDKKRHEVFDVSDIGHGYSLGSGFVNFNRYFEVNIIE